MSQDSGTESTIRNIVYKWTEIHNSKNINEFKDLYASTVLFYGSYKDEQDCIREKRTFLKNTFNQEIISSIQFNYYSSGTIKCSFTKQVTYKQKVKQYPAYLLFERRGDNYVITGESDLITDQNLHVQLNIGQEIVSSEKENIVEYIVPCILIVLAIGFFYAKKKRKSKTTNIEGTTDSNYATLAKEKKVGILNQIPERNEFTAKEKGDAFEHFVVDRFEVKYFTLVDWRSDKFHEGRYALSNMSPYLQYRLQTKNQTIEFAVECKWRNDFYDGKIEWAKEHQLNNYKRYQLEKGIEVFVIIGI
jgi:hypothetical protein